MNRLSIVRALIKSDTPVLLWGPPGVGKSSVIMQMAKDNKAHVEVLIGSTVDPVDVGGYLVPDDGGVVRSSPPPWARRLQQALARGQEAWLFLDELTCAPPAVQAALLRVVQERRVGEVDISGCRIVAAANPSDTAADGGSIPAATANRWAHMAWELDSKAWVAGELGGWGKAGVGKELAQARASVTAFISRHPTSLLAVPKDAAAERAWPSPRSWSAAIRAISVADKDSELAVVEACVGHGAASEFMTWRLANDLPDPEDMLAGRVKIPARGDRAYASLNAIVAAAGMEHSDRDKRLSQAWGILAGQRPDLAIGPAAVLLDMAAGIIPDEARDLANRLREAGA